MKRICMFLMAAAALVTLGVATASAQSLADVARKENERRKALGKATKVYTNEDVKSTRPLTTAAARPADAASPGSGAGQAGASAGQPGAVGSQATAGAAAAAGPGAAGAAGASGAAEADSAAKLTEQAEALRHQTARDRLALEALHSRMNSLQYQAEQISDPALKARFMADRDAASVEAEALRREIEERNKALTAIEEKLRSTDR